MCVTTVVLDGFVFDVPLFQLRLFAPGPGAFVLGKAYVERIVGLTCRRISRKGTHGPE